MKHSHEFRDPIHTFISVRTDGRKVIDSRPFQRLRYIHQLALSYLVYPGATHKRFEHSLGVMDVASRIFDVVTEVEHVHHDNVRNIIPDEQARSYWKSVLRMAALCHDVGHLPFSHAAEKELLPEGLPSSHSARVRHPFKGFLGRVAAGRKILYQTEKTSEYLGCGSSLGNPEGV